MEKGPDAFRTISEVADDLGLPQHVLRFWETRFPQIKPIKRGGGRRYYRPNDVDLLRGIKHLLYGEGYTIRGVQRILREQGQRRVAGYADGGAPAPDPSDGEPHEASPAVSPASESGNLVGVRSGPEMWAPQRRPAPPPTAPVSRAPVPPPAREDDDPPQAPAAVAREAAPALTPDQIRRLRGALGELDACRRLLEARL
ncbi:MerR family transcriptional regulator [Methylopila henanensis]|uniref:MerR family transcriptional regulator n=1 Tax=Methylopila henanensis TaxID=873516 RepID=A0ABW4K555_9HYPH